MPAADSMWRLEFEIESTLIEHPCVLETAVVGRTDLDGEVKPAAWVVLKREPADAAALEAELMQHCEMRLASRAPRWFHFVPALPKTATGMLLRNSLRSWNDREAAALRFAEFP
jgi:acyl-coenzyme A synthetase/AMP-(fatty) acid ligase